MCKERLRENQGKAFTLCWPLMFEDLASRALKPFPFEELVDLLMSSQGQMGCCMQRYD